MDDIECIRLRPHHLLCTLGYEGKGYDDAFVAHMDTITDRMRKGARLKVEIVNTTDDICAKCPNKLGEDLCEKNEEIKSHDKRVFEALGLCQAIYDYESLKRLLREKVTSDSLYNLCGECMWLPLTNCRRLIIEFLSGNSGMA